MHAKLLQLCLTLCNPMSYSLPGSSVHGILQARILEGVTISFSRDLHYSRIKPMPLVSPPLAGRFFFASATWEAQHQYYTTLLKIKEIEKKEMFPGSRKSILTPCIQLCPGNPSQCNKARKIHNKRHKDQKEQVKLPIFTDNKIV